MTNNIPVNRLMVTVASSSAADGPNTELSDTKQMIYVTNNRAQYYSELAKKYRDEAKEHRDNAKYYSEQNSDVTFGYIDGIKTSLETQINTKQEQGDYALKSEIPQAVSELSNDSGYVTSDELSSALEEQELPAQTNCAGMFLKTDGQNVSWKDVSAFNLFDTKISDHILEGDEALGWVLQGSLVSSVYPDAVNEIISLYNSSSSVSTTYSGISCKKTADGRYIADISQKSAIDTLFNNSKDGDFYILDSANNQFYLPRPKWFNELSVSALSSNNIKLLYYKLGTGVTNEALVDIGEVLSELQQKVNPDLSNCTKPYITQTYKSGTSWYRVWSDKWCEQGGQYVFTAEEFNHQITLLKAYKDNNYSIYTTAVQNGTWTSSTQYTTKNMANCFGATVSTKTASNFCISFFSLSYVLQWQACGYIA